MKYVDRIIPLFRLGLFLLALFVLALAVLFGSARAEFARFLGVFGAETMSYPGAAPERARVLRLNGVPISFRTQVIEASLDEVLLHYQSLCPGPDPGLAEWFSIQSVRSRDAGHVACLDMGDEARDLRSLADRFVHFAETGDLGALGGLRYIRAHRVSGTPGERTLILTIWADSALNLFRMLPADGVDAAGSDVLAVPRPRNAQRLLSAWEADSPSGFVVYRVNDESAADLVSVYRNELSANGWTIIERHSSESVAVDDVRMISAERGKRMVTVLAHSAGSSATVLSILTSEPS